MLQHQQNQMIQATHVLAKRSRRRRSVVRNICVHDWIAIAPQLGLYDCVIDELRNDDTRAFPNFMRMLPTMYDETVNRLTPALTKVTSNW
ncbi:hypothetical protein DPMN_112787 [Dreissena polymorpha]|uniref:Uncharacterized protein n=1 Tax=Dreissena polymorpha TaxID=45954 RepID=A0A9D4KH08_DREPO|nr:hypothetical protein DPMN_112787 [Dreissena polymorpha]